MAEDCFVDGDTHPSTDCPDDIDDCIGDDDAHEDARLLSADPDDSSEECDGEREATAIAEIFLQEKLGREHRTSIFSYKKNSLQLLPALAPLAIRNSFFYL